MGSVPRQIRTCEKNKINPIFGCELYVNNLQFEVKSETDNADHMRSLNDEEKQKFRKPYHLLAIAYNETGYSNLVKLSSWGWLKGFYYKPRVNHEQIMKHKEGIIFTSGCYMGEIGQAFDRGGDEAGFAMIEKYMAMFGEHFYLEMMLLDFDKQKPYDAFICRAHNKYNIPTIISQDCHVCKKEDIKMQHLMLMVQTGTTLQQVQAKNDLGELDFSQQDPNLYMKSEEEIDEKWLSDYKDIIDYDIYKQSKRNTVLICNKAKNVQLDRSIKLPQIPNDNEKLLEAIEEGFKKRHIPGSDVYKSRIREEYTLITSKGFSSYFLIQKMMCDEARRISPILLGWGDGSEAVGPGRGCCANTNVVKNCGEVVDISEIKVNDEVLTIDGQYKKVKNTFKYPVNESMLKIRSYYGDYKGVTLTKDHKILLWDVESEFQWVEAKNVKVGDWVFTPYPKLLLSEKNELSTEIKEIYFPCEKESFKTNSSSEAWSVRHKLLCLGIPSSLNKNEDEYEIIRFNKDFDVNCQSIPSGFLTSVMSIEEVNDIAEVYDFEVEDNHNYLTSSFLVHNSVCGSLVAYAIGITDVDPLKHDLLFSRFLSPARGGRTMKLKFSNDPIARVMQQEFVAPEFKSSPELIPNPDECPFE